MLISKQIFKYGKNNENHHNFKFGYYGGSNRLSET